MRKIAVYNNKGGVGKTSLAVNLAGGFERFFGKRVLVVDCDGQANATDYLLPEGTQSVDASICDAVNGISARDLIRPVYIDWHRGRRKLGIDIIPASRKMELAEVNSLFTVKDALSEIESNYDYCIFDCPPSLTDFSLSALIACSYVIVPALPDMDSLSGYDALMDVVRDIRVQGYNANLSILGVLFNGVEGRGELPGFIMDSAAGKAGGNVYSVHVRRSSVVPQARFFQKPVVYYSKGCPVSMDYASAVEETERRIRERINMYGYEI